MDEVALLGSIRWPTGKCAAFADRLAKNVFQVHGADASGRVVIRKQLRRGQVLAFFSSQPESVVAMEACSGAHFWAREIGKLGHEERLIPPACVKPFVKRQKNDMADAEAICEAAQRPTMRFVAVKSERALGSSLIDRQSQNRTVAARATAERKTLGHLSYRVATLRQSFSRPNMISICHLAAHVYMREKAVSALVSALVVFHGLAARLPAWDAWLYPFVFQCFSEPVGVVAAVRCPAMVCLQTMRGGQQPFCRWQAVHKGCRASAIADPLPGRRCVHRREGDLRS